MRGTNVRCWITSPGFNPKARSIARGNQVDASKRTRRLIAGISYEILRIGARFGNNVFVHAMFVPNIALQALTTKVPDDGQIEVAIASFKAVLEHADAVPVRPAAEHTEARQVAPPLD